MNDNLYDVIILGSGPAGYTAALYTSRAYLKTLLLAGKQLGGQLALTTEVENYPGFKNGIMGPDLMEAMRGQVVRFGTEIKLESVQSVILRSKPRPKNPRGSFAHAQDDDVGSFVIKTEKEEHKGKSIIMATGASAMYLGLPSEEKFKGKGVSACATCDGFFYKGREVMVIGGGDTAMEEATFLTKFATKITIVHRREAFRASPIMLKRVQDNPKITILTNKTVEEVLGDQTVSGVRLKDTKTGEVTEYPTQGMFLAIGHKPNTGFFKGAIDLDDKGYVVVKQAPVLEPQTETSVAGIFAAGDCVDPRYRQAIVAAGMGCMAAIDAQRWLEEQK